MAALAGMGLHTVASVQPCTLRCDGMAPHSRKAAQEASCRHKQSTHLAAPLRTHRVARAHPPLAELRHHRPERDTAQRPHCVLRRAVPLQSKDYGNLTNDDPLAILS